MSDLYDGIIETLLETQSGLYVLALALNNQEEADFSKASMMVSGMEKKVENLLGQMEELHGQFSSKDNDDADYE